MSRIIYSAQSQFDLNRLFVFLAEKDIATAQRAMLEIDKSIIDQLSKNPLLCREVAGELREYIIDFGKSGYIALFDYNQKSDTIEILAIRHQLEDDYRVMFR